MSVESAPDEPSGEQSHSRRLAEYLRERAEETDGDLYVKSKFVAEDVDLSARQIGARMGRLQEEAPDLAVEQWAYTGATTWRVTIRDR